MNKQLFIGKNIPQNTKSDATVLADGEAGVFGINATTWQTEKVAPGSTYDRIWIAMGRAAGKGSRISRTINILPSNQEFYYKKFPYSPAIGEIKLVSIDCDGSKGVYDVFALRIDSRFGDDLGGQERHSKTYHATGKFTTARAVYDKWAAEIAADGIVNSMITATATDAGLQVTGQYPEQVIEIGVEYYDNPAKEACATCSDCNAIVETTNQADSGSGTLLHLEELAAESAPYEGTAYNLDRNINSPAVLLDAQILGVGNADIIYIRYKNTDQAKGDSGKVYNMYQEIHLAYPAGTDTSAIETTLNTVLGKTIQPSLAS